MQQATHKEIRNKKRAGFTLLEMMIVLSMVVVLTSVTAVYNRDIGRQITLAQEHAKVLGLLVRARSAGFTIPRAPASVCGYGVHMDAPTRTFIFFKEACTNANRVYTDGVDDVLERVVLDQSVTVTADATDVVFMPPFGKVVINDSDTQALATITVTSAIANTTKQVKVNVYGQITE